MVASMITQASTAAHSEWTLERVDVVLIPFLPLGT
jgi:hypothetical protein